jgi:hypothetical protein
MDWCVKPYAEANHPPVAVLAHAPDLTARRGGTVNLSAAGSGDPDGDPLSFRWWHYREAGSYPGTIALHRANEPESAFTVPGDAAPAQTLHLICEVTDHGSPALTRYLRVIVTVAP